MHTRQERVTLHASPLATQLVLFSAAALALALLLRRIELIAFTAPLLGALAGASARHRRQAVLLQVHPATARILAGETARVRVEATTCSRLTGLDVRLDCPDGVTVDERTVAGVPGGISVEYALTAPDWGRFVLPVTLTVRARGGLLAATHTSPVAVEVRAYPLAAPSAVSPRAAELPDRIGAHLTRARGEGVEFAGIRPYVAGDRLRAVNWHATARTRRLYVTERHTERACDTVVVVDTPGTAPRPGTAERQGLDRAVHGAAQVVQTALRHGDRTGVFALGGRVRWLPPESGRKQFYRIADVVLDAIPGHAVGAHGVATDGATGALIPSGALTSGAMVIAFTPLLDARIVLTINNARLRGYAVAAVDVLTAMPRHATAADDPLVARLWRLQRRGLHRNLASLGVPVMPWRTESSLDEVLQPLARRPLRAHPPRRAP
ncbi:DUF58 domain-containing protein [Haloechinothrix sp. LS1_15]|uniref:DUF58 domain-containing protein n=1 Tax=Haloechinothrix sp. LS1_15 TaxID=2652248 RepID=UPI002945AA88|nr:DUF58 domain-containing protein [Haloechinothrix sp. LS1_15]MDV6014447.1 DUF58 domain-containing protein [Haloechinothrix sp. LS1_15]